jgi:hypothetical protein
MPRTYKYSFSLRFPHQNPVRGSPLHMHATCSAILTVLNVIIRLTLGQKVKVMKLLIMYFFPVCCDLICLRQTKLKRWENYYKFLQIVIHFAVLHVPWKVITCLAFNSFRKIAKKLLLASSRLSVRPSGCRSACKNSAPNGRIFMKFNTSTWVFFEAL